MEWMTVVDCLLALGFSLRLTRLVVTDDLGGWLIRIPAQKWAMRSGEDWRKSWRYKLVSGLECPFCVGTWLAGLVLLSLLLSGGPGSTDTLAVVWRWVAALFTLNWVAAHVGSRLGDAGYDDEDD